MRGFSRPCLIFDRSRSRRHHFMWDFYILIFFLVVRDLANNNLSLIVVVQDHVIYVGILAYSI